MKIFALLIFFIFGIGLIGINFKSTDKTNSISSYYSERIHQSGLTWSPILITNDGDFTPANGVVEGTGTSNDPYIIANWTINAGWSGSCIYISGTTAYFIIRNCTLINSGSFSTNAGIRLLNSHNGQILNNTCSNNLKCGIRSSSCTNFTFSRNIIFNFNRGQMTPL